MYIFFEVPLRYILEMYLRSGTLQT
jgi:hypothetical protein